MKFSLLIIKEETKQKEKQNKKDKRKQKTNTKKEKRKGKEMSLFCFLLMNAAVKAINTMFFAMVSSKVVITTVTLCFSPEREQRFSLNLRFAEKELQYCVYVSGSS